MITTSTDLEWNECEFCHHLRINHDSLGCKVGDAEYGCTCLAPFGVPWFSVSRDD